jgi:hypothetical protein
MLLGLPSQFNLPSQHCEPFLPMVTTPSSNDASQPSSKSAESSQGSQNSSRSALNVLEGNAVSDALQPNGARGRKKRPLRAPFKRPKSLTPPPQSAPTQAAVPAVSTMPCVEHEPDSACMGPKARSKPVCDMPAPWRVHVSPPPKSAKGDTPSGDDVRKHMERLREFLAIVDPR